MVVLVLITSCHVSENLIPVRYRYAPFMPDA